MTFLEVYPIPKSNLVGGVLEWVTQEELSICSSFITLFPVWIYSIIYTVYTTFFKSFNEALFPGFFVPSLQSFKGEIRKQVLKKNKHFRTKQWKLDENQLKKWESYGHIENFTNFQETFLDQSIWICKWVSWWCHHLTIFNSFCKQKWHKFHISAMRMLDLPQFLSEWMQNNVNSHTRSWYEGHTIISLG